MALAVVQLVHQLVSVVGVDQVHETTGVLVVGVRLRTLEEAAVVVAQPGRQEPQPPEVTEETVLVLQ